MRTTVFELLCRPVFRLSFSATRIRGCDGFWAVIFKLPLLLLMLAGLGGCAARPAFLSSGMGVQTTADKRIIFQVKRELVAGSSKLQTEYVTCAEPSPDIARLVSESLNLSTTASASEASGTVNPALALAIASAHAEGMAQLTERLATIQLLRDGLYRACEAYANGAISATTYAVMLSRFDDTMITMLMGEFAAGNYARQPLALFAAGAVGGVQQSVPAAPETGEEDEEEDTPEDALEQKLNEAEAAADDEQQAAVKALQSDDVSDTAASGINSTILKSEAKKSATMQALAQQAIDTARDLRASANSAAITVPVPAALREKQPESPPANGQGSDVQETIRTLQERYLHNLNSDAISVACLTAMDNHLLSKEATTSIARIHSLKQNLADDPQDPGSIKAAIEEEQKNRDELLAVESATLLSIHCQNDVLPEIARGQTELLLELKRNARWRRGQPAFCAKKPASVDFLEKEPPTPQAAVDAAILQTWLNECGHAEVQVNGKADRSTSDAYFKRFGRYLPLDPRANEK